MAHTGEMRQGAGASELRRRWSSAIGRIVILAFLALMAVVSWAGEAI